MQALYSACPTSVVQLWVGRQVHISKPLIVTKHVGGLGGQESFSGKLEVMVDKALSSEGYTKATLSLVMSLVFHFQIVAKVEFHIATLAPLKLIRRSSSLRQDLSRGACWSRLQSRPELVSYLADYRGANNLSLPPSFQTSTRLYTLSTPLVTGRAAVFQRDGFNGEARLLQCPIARSSIKQTCERGEDFTEPRLRALFPSQRRKVGR